MIDAPVFETARLRCRRWKHSDLKPLQAVYGDADAMRWVGDGSPLTEAQTVQWLEVTARNYETRGYGMFALEDRETGEVVGFAGIVHPGGQIEAEVKYALARAHWGRGLASEAVRALITAASSAFGLSALIATVAPENAASRRVLANAGMHLQQERANPDGSRTLVYGWEAKVAHGAA